MMKPRSGDSRNDGGQGARERVDFVVIGAGPAGQKAAVQLAKAGKSVVVVERASGVGGECVHRGTIPSKTLRETASYLAGLRVRSEGVLEHELRGDIKVESLMRRRHAVAEAHQKFIGDQLSRNGIEVRRGRARFVSEHEIEVAGLDGSTSILEAGAVFLATGSRPRTPEEVPVDHENILDSDSILSLLYLPRTLIVLGAGVIASEFASLFAALGVKVQIVDRGDRPMGFLDPELTDSFLKSFEDMGGSFLGSRKVESVDASTPGEVVVTLEGGEELRSEKVLCALGRVAQVKGLGLDVVGITLGPRGTIEVDEHFRTSVPHIYAVGDVIGPPALAATSMEQGRRAACHALHLFYDTETPLTPAGIYSIPEMAGVGLTEAQAGEIYGSVLVGRSRFNELARGQINGGTHGLLKLVTDENQRVLGVHVVGESATELVHIGQMALIAGLTVDVFVDHVFNFPTMAEAYRVAALDIQGQVARRERERAA